MFKIITVWQGWRDGDFITRRGEVRVEELLDALGIDIEQELLVGDVIDVLKLLKLGEVVLDDTGRTHVLREGAFIGYGVGYGFVG